jgi:two-component sensor histidine kinase
VVISAVRDENQVLTGFVKVTRDFSERQKTRAALEAREASLAASLKEREVMLQEIHHRVKNNLQVIASLITMQMRQLHDVASKSALEECKMRVQAIALIHEKLYQSRDFASIPFSSYARGLASNIFQATGMSSAVVTLELDISPVMLTVDKAIPCGLILNELITNALKHAFPNERQGKLRVALQRITGGEISLSVADDGIGIDADFDVETCNSLGLQLVSTLVAQLDGALTITRHAGTVFEVRFPAELND